MSLYIPHITPEDSALDAALAYIKAGWFVLPVRRGEKNPGGVVGGDWPSLSSRDEQQIREWYTGTDYGIALHAGRSGALFLDVDNPEQTPEVIARAIRETNPPSQATRRGDTGRGHYLFDADGESYSNSLGTLPPGFGDVRGRNGVVVVAPSVHAKADQGGLYHWLTTGPVPKLPEYLAQHLTKAGEVSKSISSVQADEFITKHQGNDRPELLDTVIRKLEERIVSGEGRHEALKRTLPWALRESIAGFYPASTVAERMLSIFTEACQRPDLGGGSVRTPGEALREFESVFTWAAAQAMRADPEETRSSVAKKMTIVSGPSMAQDIDPEEWLNVTDYTTEPERWLHPDMLNDVGSAARLAELLSEKIRYVDGVGWHVWNGKVWLSDGNEAPNVHEMIRRANRKLLDDRDAIKALNGGVSTDQEKFISYSLSSRGLKNVENELRRTFSLRWSPDQVDAHPDLLTVRNGVLNLRTGELGPHDPRLGLTRILEVDYDPSATAPRWEMFIKEIFPNHSDLVPFMQRLIGYGVTGHVSEHAMAIFYGRGRNGKSVFINTLDHVFGAVSTTADWTTFERAKSNAGGARGDLARLRGARLVHVSEGNAGSRIDEAKLKQTVAGDKLTVRALYKDDVTFEPTFLLMMATNAKPDFQGADDGLWERVKLIPFEAYFGPDQRDPGLTDKLKSESAGILNWVVAGAMAWYRSGLQEPSVVKEATKEYRETSDVLYGFIGEYGVFVNDPDGAVETSVLYERYQAWAKSEGLSERDSWSATALGRELGQRGYDSKRKQSRNNGQVESHTVRLRLSLNLSHPLNRTMARSALRNTTAVDGTTADVVNL